MTNHIADDYDYFKLIKIFARLGARKLYRTLTSNDKCMKNYILDLENLNANICTDLITYYLIETSPTFHRLVLNNLNKLDFSRVGSFTTNDFVTLA